MRKILFAISLLLLFSISASFGYSKLVRLTVINQSGYPIEIKLTVTSEGNIYYLRIPRGDRTAPTAKTFTIVPDVYQATLYYVELWDPVYGYSCSSKSQTIDANHNVEVVVFECDRRIAKPGEFPRIKFGASSSGQRRELWRSASSLLTR